MAREQEKRQPEAGQQQAREGREVTRRESASRVTAPPASSPFFLMGRFMEDMDRILGGLLGPGLMPRIDVAPRGREGREASWVPAIELSEREGQLVVRADVPGLTADQIDVEVENGQLVLSGERRQEHEERRGDIYRTERVYGSFRRAIPLPDDADAEQAKATFANGVLEITIPVAHREPSRKRIDVREGSGSENPPSGQTRTGSQQQPSTPKQPSGSTA